MKNSVRKRILYAPFVKGVGEFLAESESFLPHLDGKPPSKWANIN
jgi:hypothetical protein